MFSRLIANKLKQLTVLSRDDIAAMVSRDPVNTVQSTVTFQTATGLEPRPIVVFVPSRGDGEGARVDLTLARMTTFELHVVGTVPKRIHRPEEAKIDARVTIHYPNERGEAAKLSVDGRLDLYTYDDGTCLCRLDIAGFTVTLDYVPLVKLLEPAFFEILPGPRPPFVKAHWA